MPIRKELRHLYRTPSYIAARAAAKERSGDACERCKRANGSSAKNRWDEDIKIQCGAAHLNGVAGDDRPENVAWLCRGCHLHHDKPFHKLSRATRKDRARPILVKAKEPYQTTIEEQLALLTPAVIHERLTRLAEKASAMCAAEGRPDTPQLEALKTYLRKEQSNDRS